ncbi:MAG: non-canonical purine NTP pyrophosphatase [Candidatus Sericytochromatia bacterium]|nr:non-canonical purine NTP pyrophosphatase [Candidatus Tanganyikabacteria bacterium]
MTLYFVTTSAGKFAEAERLIPGLRQLAADLPEIQEFDAAAIIRAKLDAARRGHEGEFIVEDTSLYLDALNGLPGPFIKWFLARLGPQGIYDLAEKLGDTRASARTCVGYADPGGVTRFFEGTVTGHVVAPRGERGFGWDPLFVPHGSDLTFAQMDPAEKQRFSMRRLALEDFRRFHAAR